MDELLKHIVAELKDPAVLRAAAALAELTPEPGPVLAAGLRVAAQWIESGKTLDEVNAIVARASVDAQALADGWRG